MESEFPKLFMNMDFLTLRPVFNTLCCVLSHLCMPAKSLQSCLTLWDPIDSSPWGSSVHGILHARILERVATPFSRGPSWPRDWPMSLGAPALQADSFLLSHQGSPGLTQSCLTLCCPVGCNPWDFSGKNTGVGCHFLLQGIFPCQGLNLCIPHQQTDSLPLSHLKSLMWQ